MRSHVGAQNSPSCKKPFSTLGFILAFINVKHAGVWKLVSRRYPPLSEQRLNEVRNGRKTSVLRTISREHAIDALADGVMWC
jgi:hypothetical protein